MPAADEPVRHEQRFEWVDDKRTRHFRVVTQIDNRVAVRGGVRIDGVDHPDGAVAGGHKCVSNAEATRAYNELITSLNYSHPMVETSRDVAPSDYRPAEHPVLEAQCRASPDDPGPWSVYADWLIAQGDPIGEIASRASAGQHAAAKQILRDHQRDLVGHVDHQLPVLEYRHGFVVGATLATRHDDGNDLEELTRTLLRAPIARFVERLRFGLAGHESNNDWAATLRAVTESPQAAHIRALRFDAYTRDDQEISWTAFGDFSFAWPYLPALELLHIKAGGDGTLGDLQLPALKTFIRESGGLGADELAAIAKARWPALEHLEVWFGSSNYGAAGTIDSLRDILANDLPRLRHLGVVNCEFVDDVIPALVSWPGLARLESLDLSKGVMHARATAALVANAKRFRHLASIDLSENLLEESHIDAIRAVLDNVIVGEQREYDFEDGDDEEDFPRYVAVGE